MLNHSRDRRRYQAVFFTRYGLGPYTCYFCDEDIFFDVIKGNNKLHIHHISDNIDDVVPAHHGCHARSHALQTGLGTKNCRPPAGDEHWTRSKPHLLLTGNRHWMNVQNHKPTRDNKGRFIKK